MAIVQLFFKVSASKAMCDYHLKKATSFDINSRNGYCEIIISKLLKGCSNEPVACQKTQGKHQIAEMRPLIFLHSGRPLIYQ